MRYIPTTEALVENFKQTARKMKRSAAIKQADALDRVACSHGYNHWGHVMWCQRATARISGCGQDVKMDYIDPENLSFGDEVEYIIKCAKEGDGTIVSLKTCLLFSTSDGDAWLLDVVTKYALCLSWHGERQTFTIVENKRSFAIQYDAQFGVEGDSFFVTSDNPNIGSRTIALGYPAREIAGFAEVVRQRESHNLKQGTF